jgi:glutaminyl-peptide cyclotransferase
MSRLLSNRRTIVLALIAFVAFIVALGAAIPAVEPTTQPTGTSANTLAAEPSIGAATKSANSTAESVEIEAEIAVLVPTILEIYPHDTRAYTQGLLLYEGTFFESTGQYGRSSLRQVQPETGDVIREVPLEPNYFAEGLALVADELYQITWREGKAFVYDRETFQVVREYTYQGDGWGLCYDGTALYMTDGSNILYTRDPETFEVTRTVPVTLNGNPFPSINELECVGDHIYANVYLTDVIVRFDKQTGIIDQYIWAWNLLPTEERAELDAGQVLNGIAYDPDADVFYVTGKDWSKLWRVQFVPCESACPNPLTFPDLTTN